MLKNLLALLLAKFYSKQESGEVAKQSYPSTAATTIQLTPSDGVTNKEMSYTPPSDGYIVLRDQGLPQSSSYLITGQYAEGVARGDKILFDFLMMTPVLKGVPVTIRYCGQGSVAQFIKNIGGGYQDLKKLILQGGAICLSNLCSSLRRSSCRVRRNGSEVKVFSQTQIPEQRSLLTTLRLNFIRLQVMDGLHSAETDHRSMSALLESWERVALTLKVISELQLRFGRGIPLVSIARRTISNRLRQNSFPAKGQRNTSLVGGASC